MLSTLEVNALLAGMDLSNTKAESYTRTVVRSKNMLEIINNALEAVRQDPDHGELMYQIWSKASEIMKDVYTQILAISTIAAVVTASIALLLMNFSKSGKTVDESRAWLKRIIITWAILNSLGFILAYITPFFSGGAWTA